MVAVTTRLCRREMGSIIEEKEWQPEDGASCQHVVTSIFPPQNEPHEGFSTNNRYFADSPYYDEFVEKELHSAKDISDVLQDIDTKIMDYSRATKLLVKSINSLSKSCRQYSTSTSHHDRDETQSGEAEGGEIEILQNFGEALEAIASTQEYLQDQIESALGYRLMDLAVKQRNVFNTLKKEKKEADIQTRLSEQKLFQYINSDNKVNADKDVSPTSNNLFKFKRRKFSRCPTAHPPRIGCETVGKMNEKSSSRVTDSKSSVVGIRVEETEAELKRFELCKSLMNANYKRKLELSRTNENFLHGVQNKFQLCSEKLANILSKVNQNQQKLIDARKSEKLLWEKQEQILRQTLLELKREDEIDRLPNERDTKSGLSISDMKREAKIWELPNKLASISQFSRPSRPDVLMEGWLHQQCSSMMSLQSSWTRRWFILKHDGIYYLESNGEDGKSSTTEVKLFEAVLYTVRELLDGPVAARFCFQLIDSNNKTFTLQAKGPRELQGWLTSIRSAVESQIAKVDLPSSARNLDYVITTGREGSEMSNGGHSILEDPQQNHEVANKSSSSISIRQRVRNVDNPLIVQILTANPTCADCGAAHPDWASLNLGVLVCLKCSGVHRSLGCHVSKIRSLLLDKLSDDEASRLLSLGNDRINDIFEGGMKNEDKVLRKKACIDDQAAREEWIKSKYVKKNFTRDVFVF